MLNGGLWDTTREVVGVDLHRTTLNTESRTLDADSLDVRGNHGL